MTAPEGTEHPTPSVRVQRHGSLPSMQRWYLRSATGGWSPQQPSQGFRLRRDAVRYAKEQGWVMVR